MLAAFMHGEPVRVFSTISTHFTRKRIAIAMDSLMPFDGRSLNCTERAKPVETGARGYQDASVAPTVNHTHPEAESNDSAQFVILACICTVHAG